MKPLGRKQRQRGRLLRLGALYRCTVTAVTERGLDVDVADGGGETVKGCVPLHHLTDNASLALMLVATYKVNSRVLRLVKGE
jgi:ribosomal protein S1